MKIKLERVFIPLSIIIVILTSIGVSLCYSDRITQFEEMIIDMERVNSESKIRNNTKVLLNTFKSIQFTINTLTSKIHKDLFTNINNILVNNEIHTDIYKNSLENYDGYSYHYAIFSCEGDKIKPNVVVSSVNSDNYNLLIYNYLNDVYNTESSFSKLKYNQLVTRLFRLNRTVYVISFSGLSDKHGKIYGLIAVLIPLAEFIKINDYVEKDIEIVLVDNTSKSVVYSLNESYTIDSNILKKNVLDISNLVSIERNNNANVTMKYFEGLDFIIVSSNIKIIDNKIEKNSVKFSILICCYVIIILAMLISVLIILIHKVNDVINDVINNNYKINENVNNIYRKRTLFIFDKKELTEYINSIKVFIKNNEEKKQFHNNNNLIMNNTREEMYKQIRSIKDNELVDIVNKWQTLERAIRNIECDSKKNKELHRTIAEIENINNKNIINISIINDRLKDDGLDDLLISEQFLNSKVRILLGYYMMPINFIPEKLIEENNIRYNIDNIKDKINVQYILLQQLYNISS